MDTEMMEYKIRPGVIWIYTFLFMIISIFFLYLYIDSRDKYYLFWELLLVCVAVYEYRDYKKHRNDMIIVSDAGIYISFLGEEKMFKWENIKLIVFGKKISTGVYVRIVSDKKNTFDINFGIGSYWVVNFYRLKKKICILSGRKDIIRIKSKMWYITIA